MTQGRSEAGTLPALVTIPFVHCHGSGNDFPLIDVRAGRCDAPLDWPAVARAFADRSGPVGGDGLLLLTDGDADHVAGFRMFNADGSEAETCLNGVRCVARAAFAALGVEQGLLRLVGSSVAVAREAEIAPGVYTVRETAAPADLDACSWVHAGLDRVIDRAVPGLPTDRAITAIRIPNPHLIAFVDAIDEAELVALGRWCEAAPALLPHRANISFVELRDAATLFVRTFERGVGLTDSCGSAMAASSLAACLTGRTAFDVGLTVLNRGGLVRASVAPDGRVTLAGNATWEWSGTIAFNPRSGALDDLRVDKRFPAEIAAWQAVAAAAR